MSKLPHKSPEDGTVDVCRTIGYFGNPTSAVSQQVERRTAEERAGAAVILKEKIQPFLQRELRLRMQFRERRLTRLLIIQRAEVDRLDGRSLFRVKPSA